MSATLTFPTYDTVDGFAGPGGWSLAAQRLGLREIGLEFDKGAHLTRRAAGFHTIRDDVRNWGPANFPNALGKIDSPPCQTFSMAGKGAGRAALDQVLHLILRMGNGEKIDAAHWEGDPRTVLVLEPLRWALEAIELGQAYEWLAWEQVPAVLPVWEAMAAVLRSRGYYTATGLLQAEQYGVPQTRRRAILMARRDRQVHLPTPTHSRFHTRDKARLDPGVLPWVSMEQALGWPPVDVVLRASVSEAGTKKGTPRLSSQPSQTVTGKHRSADWIYRSSTMPNATRRELNEPAPTIAFGNDANSAGWVAVQFGNQDHSAVRQREEPAATVRYSARMNACDWISDPPTGRRRVSVQEAACFQSFPSDFPWQGAMTKRYEQVGNAIPPLLAEAVLRAVL